jgi:hypothetical protein
MAILTTVNADLRKKKKTKWLHYTTGYDMVLQKQQKEMFTDVDLEKEVKAQEIFSKILHTIILQF